ncbi:gliding motility lipoprotein GldB [Patiriisocius marinistellae]
MKKLLLLFISVGMLIACEQKSTVEKEIEKISVDVSVLRFDKVFAKASITDLPKLKSQYPMFFSPRVSDSIYEQRLNDTLQHQLEDEVLKAFPSEEKLSDELGPLFQHIKYYFPRFNEPTIATVISDVDYDNKVIIADTLLVVSLDTYLGSDHFFYSDISKFITKNMRSEQIMPDIATQYVRKLVSPPGSNSLLSQMIYFGKELYLKDIWLPEISEAERIGYTDAEMQWAKANEEQIWRYFVEREMLFNTDPKLSPRFINPAPFTKFYLDIDNESPGMMGRYMGWQIVRSFMEKNEVTPQQLLLFDAETLYQKSKYKPKK